MSRPSPRTVQDIVQGLTRVPGRRAVGLRSDLGLRWWKYGRLSTEVRRAALHLEELGVGKGGAVVLWGANSPEWVAYFLAAAWRGAVAVPVDHKLSQDFAGRVAAEAGSPAILHGGQASADGNGAALVPLLGLSERPDPKGLAAQPAFAVAPGDPAAILYSSGTTGVPHGVTLTHGNLAAQVAAFGGWRLGIDLHPVRMLSASPLSHVQGLVAGLLLPLHLGLCLTFVQSAEPAHLLRVLRDNRITIVLTVPRLLRAMSEALLRTRVAENGPLLAAHLAAQPGWLQRLELVRHTRRIAGRQLRLILVGGARLPLETERFWRRANVLVMQGYGLTETAGPVAYSNPFSLRPGTLGRPASQHEVRLAPDGEILVRGPGVALNDDRAPDGFFPTGDLGALDAVGRLLFLGRKKELIVTSEGLNVDPAEVEAALERQPGVVASAVVAYADAGVEEVHAVLVLKPESDAAEVVRRANGELPEPARIRSWTVWPGEDLPRGPLGKVRRTEVVSALAQRPPEPASAAADGEPPGFDRILAEPDPSLRLRLLARHVARPDLAASDGAALELVDQFGLGSLDVVELLAHLEDLQGAPLEGLAVDRATTLADLHRQVRLASEGAAMRGSSHEPGARPWQPARYAPVRQSPVAELLPVTLLRPLVRRLVTSVWAALHTRTEVVWSFDPATLKPPVIIAGGPHLHWHDLLAVSHVLPPQLRRRILVVTDPFLHSYKSFFYYHVVAPSLFAIAFLRPFGRSREGLLEAGRLLDLRHTMLTFPAGPRPSEDPRDFNPGGSRFALEAGVPIVPVRLSGNQGIGWKPRRPRRLFRLHFGEPIVPSPAMDTAQVLAELQRAFERLQQAAAPPGANAPE